MKESIIQFFYSRFVPFLQWLPELRNKSVLRADFMAGLTVALVLIPQSMAYAQLAGLPPYYGLYASFLPPIVAALFGSSRQLATGPVAVVSLLTASALGPLAVAGGPTYIAYAILLALLVGLFQLALGLLRLGLLVNFLSHPVVLGFTNAAAIIIATSQLGKIFGVSIEKSANQPQYEVVWNTLAAAVSNTHWPTFFFAVLAFAIMIGMRRISPKIPGVLLAVVITTVLAWTLDFEKVKFAKPEQFSNQGEQQLVSELLQLRVKITSQQAKVDKADEHYEKTLEKYGDDNSRSLRASHSLEMQRLRLERLKNTVKADLRQLKSVHFVYVPQETRVGRFYTHDEMPEGANTDGYTWRVTDIDKKGMLTLHAGGMVVGTIPEGLPSMRMPTLDFAAISQLALSALAITLIGFMEAISIAKAMAARTRQRLDPNQELVGQGLSNIVGSLFQSYPVSGSFSRSAVSISSGALTGFSSVVTGIIVLVTLLWFTPWLYYLPQATLAAVIMMAVIGLVNLPAVKHTWKAQPQDGIVAIATFVLTLFFAPHLDRSIMIGVLLSLVLYLYRTMKPRVAVLSRHTDGTLRDAEIYGLRTCPEISLIRFDGSLYFANTSYFEDKVNERLSKKPDMKFIIVDAAGINEVDASGEEMLAQLTDRLAKSGVEVLLTRIKKQVMDVFRSSGFLEHVGEHRIYRKNEEALEYAWSKLGNEHEVDCPLNIVCPIKEAGSS